VPNGTGPGSGVALDDDGTKPTTIIEQTSAALPKTASLSVRRGRANRRMTGGMEWLAVSDDMTLSLD
jgi:hypothetical protein